MANDLTQEERALWRQVCRATELYNDTNTREVLGHMFDSLASGRERVVLSHQGAYLHARGRCSLMALCVERKLLDSTRFLRRARTSSLATART